MSKRVKSKEFIESDSDEDSDTEKPKKSKKVKSKQQESVEKEQKNSSESATSWEIGRKRRVTISEFRGKKLISIREYYTDDSGEDKPGRKGISLTVDQWKELCKVTDKVNQALVDE